MYIEKREGVASWLTKTHPDEIVKSTDDPSSSSSDESEQPSIKKWKQDSKSSSSVCYICQLASLPGKFFPKKAVELGVPKGPLFTDLHFGKAVTLEDGRQVSLKPCSYNLFLVVMTKTVRINSIVSTVTKELTVQ